MSCLAVSVALKNASMGGRFSSERKRTAIGEGTYHVPLAEARGDGPYARDKTKSPASLPDGPDAVRP